jgi:hypothetical protein
MSTFELIRDLHKDARGFRPSAEWMAVFNGKSDVEKEATWNALCEELAVSEAEDERREVAAVEAYNARINGMVADYGISRETAMRWDLDAFEVDISYITEYPGAVTQEIEFYLWKQGISSFARSTPLRNEIINGLRDLQEA